MTRTLLTVAVALLLIIASTPASAASILDRGPDVPPVVEAGTNGHPSYIVELSDDNTTESVDALRDWVDASSDRRLLRVDEATGTATVSAPAWEVNAGLWSRVKALTSVDATDYPSVLRPSQLRDRSYIEAIHPNYRLENLEPVPSLENVSDFEAPTVGVTGLDDPDYPTKGVAFDEDATRTTMQKSRDILGADNITRDGSGLTLAIIDTGYSVADGQVAGNGSVNSTLRISDASKNFITDESVNTSAGNYTAIEDGQGHGSWVFSAALGNASGTVHDGLAPNATGLVLKALDDDGQGSTSDIAAAIRYAADQDADVISMSLGSQIYSEPIADAVDYALDNDVKAVVVAAGNSRMTTAPGIATPGDLQEPGVITVGAINGSEPSEASSAYFSQVGPDPSTGDLGKFESQGATVDVVAPGMATVARVPTNGGTYVENNTLSGTSMATPMVAGGIIAALSENASLRRSTPEEIETAVTESARPAPHLAASEAGHGVFAVDNLVDGTHPETSQADSRTTPAEQRDDWYEASYDAQFGWTASVASRVGIGG